MEAVSFTIEEITLKGEDARQFLNLLQYVKASAMPEWQKRWALAALQEIGCEAKMQITGEY